MLRRSLVTVLAGTLAVLAPGALGALGAGCGAPAGFRPAWPDAQVELRDDGDRQQAIDRLWVLPAGDERDLARGRIAAAVARRIADALDDDQPFVAAALLEQLSEMWQHDPAALGRGLARHAALLRTLRATFARSGALEPVVHTLVLLAEADPAERGAHLAELDEVLGFADELAVAEHGPNATRAEPIELLQDTALRLPLPWLTDRYVALLVERQRAVGALVDQQGPSMQLVRAHHDVLVTARRIANALARAGRAPEIHGRLAQLVGGYGVDRELAIRAEVVAEHPTAEAYARLASVLRADNQASDPAAALALCLAGLARFPGDAGLLAAAGGDARVLGRIDQAIALYEQALHATGELDGGEPPTGSAAARGSIDAAIALRLGRMYAERIQRLATSGRPSAANDAWREALRFTARAASAHPHAVWQQAAAVAESALGRGLASQGMLDHAKHALIASIARAPSVDAYETLVTIDMQTERYAEAHRLAQQGIAMIGDRTAGDRYRRAKLERLSADNLRRSGQDKAAARRYLEALRTWASLGDTRELPRPIAAERELDIARAIWWLGDPGKAVDHAMRALEHDPESEELAASAVAFLLVAGRHRDAVDAYHRSLGEPGVGEYHKVYMSLWIVGDAVQRGEPRDRLASEYLAGRKGDMWYEQLAQHAAGRLSLEELRRAAISGPRRAELAFYSAVLGSDPAAATPAGKQKLLQEVVGAHLVLDAEYDLARMYLQASAPAP